MKECRACPWECGADRIAAPSGICRTGALPMVSSYNIHLGEEPPISGYKGSGTIFLTNCNLKCQYCQNYPISQMGHGQEYSLTRFANMMLELQKKGAHNINFVTPSHQVVQIKRGVLCAREQGLAIPIVYNSSGYDSLWQLKYLEGIVDIFLVDMRYGRDDEALKYSGARNYVAVNRQALLEMYRQVGDLVMDQYDVATRGIIIRHLVLPNGISHSKGILEFIHDKLSSNTYISLMSQYFPAYEAVNCPELSRRVTRKEYREVVNYMEELGLDQGWTQCYE
ncbi:radical SAM protein [bacterium]|nr:radical SAM protein [bacterium]